MAKEQKPEIRCIQHATARHIFMGRLVAEDAFAAILKRRGIKELRENKAQNARNQLDFQGM